MKVKIITISKPKFDYISAGEQDYLDRLKKYCDVEVINIKEEPITKNRNLEEIMEIEGERLVDKLNTDFVNVALHVMGEQKTSEQFADLIQEVKDFKGAKICFIIGGPLGLSQKVLSSVDHVLSFSKMTFTHQLIRLLLLEQIYRGFEILKGTKYHK